MCNRVEYSVFFNHVSMVAIKRDSRKCRWHFGLQPHFLLTIISHCLHFVKGKVVNLFGQFFFLVCFYYLCIYAIWIECQFTVAEIVIKRKAIYSNWIKTNKVKKEQNPIELCMWIDNCCYANPVSNLLKPNSVSTGWDFALLCACGDINLSGSLNSFLFVFFLCVTFVVTFCIPCEFFMVFFIRMFGVYCSVCVDADILYI